MNKLWISGFIYGTILGLSITLIICVHINSEFRELHSKYIKESESRMDIEKLRFDIFAVETIIKNQNAIMIKQTEIFKVLANNQKMISYAILGDDFIKDPKKVREVLEK